mmetsp:Transcript_40689/g.46783  ORF Transcript_40689/g.46783 Transcript_40689/m.46783 type:complete len:308 (+) Transcript_40689:64-987(+)
MQSHNGYYTLNSGHKIPTVALGTWQSSSSDVKDAVKTALCAGYKSIDTATLYGNEAAIGEALSETISSGKVKREDLFITTKLWNDAHRADEVEKSCKKSLQDLQLQYIDLLLIHWPWSGSADWKDMSVNLDYVPLSETWKAMEQLVDQGLVKSIGISNFNVQLILDLICYARIKPAVLQIEMHPYHPQELLVQWCAKENILVEAYCPLGLGSVPGMEGPKVQKLIERSEIQEIAGKYGKTAAQVLVAWGVTRGTRVLPKSVTASRIEENIGGAEFRLSEEDMEKIKNIPERAVIYEIWSHLGLPIFS